MTRLQTQPDIQVVEVSGESAESWGDAVWHAIAPALGTGRHVLGLDVIHNTAEPHGSGVEYHVDVRLSYTS